MKYVYKIYSGYDGFTPAQISSRAEHGHTLRLGWKKYIDAVEVSDEVWVYFHGPHKFENGVYAKGIIEEVDYDNAEIALRITDSSTTVPLTTPAQSTSIAAVVATRYRQVFVLPVELDVGPRCDVATTASSCAARGCGGCRAWSRLPTVNRQILQVPPRLDGYVDRYAPAYWVVPGRCFLLRRGRVVRVGVQRSSELFMRYKTGEAALAYPLALGMHRALAKAHRLDFDAVIPVPLSPDKAKAGELHRTLGLAKELGRLLHTPVRDWLRLSGAISKRKLRTGHGYTAAQFEAAYSQKLQVEHQVATARRILLVDDVCTEGSTLKMCAQAIAAANSQAEVVAATAGQMSILSAVSDPTSLWEP